MLSYLKSLHTKTNVSGLCSQRVLTQTVAFHSHVPIQKCDPFFVKFPKEPPADFQVPVYSLKKGRQIDTITLPSEVFGVPVRADLLHRVVTWHLSCKRQGTASTKNRAEVAGSGRKIAQQKGRGRARVGSIRSPTRRGGGTAHGPKPRDWHYALPKKIRQLGLKCALSSKYSQNKLIIIDQTDLKTHKTKNLIQILQRFQWKDALLIEQSTHPFLKMAHLNIPKIEYKSAKQLNVYDILHREVLALHRNALPYIKKRVGLVENAATPISNIILEPQEASIVSDDNEDYDHIAEEGDDDDSDNEDFDEFLRKEMEEVNTNKTKFI